MPARKFSIQGQIIDRETEDGIPNLAVTATAINVKSTDDVFARATTDEQGNFTMKFTDLDLQAYAGQIPSPLFFNIYQGDFLLEDTRSTHTWSLRADGMNPITRFTIAIARTQETFIVRGRIVTSDGSPPTQRLTVRASNQGIGRTTVLASERIQTDGSYEIEYSRSQLEPGQERANLVVEVFTVPTLRRPLISSPLILNADPEETINLAIPDPDQDFRGLSLYAQLRSQLSPHIPAGSINTLTNRDIILLAQKAQMTEQQASYLIQAFRLSERTSFDPAIWFALFSQGSVPDLAILLAEGEAIHRTRLSEAIAANIIGQSYEPQIDDIIARLQTLGIEETLADRDEPTDQPSIRAVLNRTQLSPEQKQTFLRTWTAQKSSPQEFWTSLRQSNDFQDEEVNELQRVTQLNILSLGHTSMADSLLRSGVRDAKQVATLEVDNLLDLMSNVDPPEEVEGESIAERKRTYAGKMLELAIQSFPTTRLLHKWTTDPEVNTEDIATFSRNNGEFEFKTTNVRKYLRDNPQALEGVRDREGLTAQLEGMGRLFSLIPQDDKFNVLRTLWQSDVPNSAFGIVHIGESAFVRKFEGELQAEQAKEIYAYAKHKATVTTATLMRYSQLFNPTQLYALNWTGPQQLPDDIPDWGTLFGSLDFCECQHCRSIQSPAAYLVDLLQFLDQANAGNRFGLDQLLRQRPDLAHIQLNCANTNTAMPYIDLVNEVLENAVVNGLTLSTADTPQTTLTTEELRANPEHIRPEAYDGVLAQNRSTWSLPFDLSHEERQTYLNHLGISVSQLMDTFHRPGESPEAIDRATATLGMTLVERRIITGETGEHGLGTSNAILPMLKRSQLDYDTLNDLLISRFINPTNKEIEFEGDSCALEDATLDLTADERDRLHRFTRLYRLMGWSITDLDQAIVVIGDRTIDNAFLIQLAYMKQLKERFKLLIPELLSWWTNIPTHSYGDEKPWYKRLFLNPAVNDLKERDPQNPNRINQLFALNTDRTELRRPNERQFFLTEEELDPEITPLVLAAINISADELRLLIQEMLPDDNINLANLSHLYRVASFSRTLRISIQDYLVLVRLTGQQGLTHFNLSDTTSQPTTPEITWNFIQQFDSLTASGFKIQELDYLLTHRFLPTFPLPFTNETIAITLAELQTELRKIRLSQPLANLQLAELKELLVEKLSFIVEDTATAITIIEGTSDPASDLTDEAQQTYLEENFSSFLDIPLAIQNLVQDGLTEPSSRILCVLQPLLGFLSQNVVIQQLTSAIGLEMEVCDALLKRHLSHPQDANQQAISVFLDEAFIYSNLNTAEAIAAVLNATPMPADVDSVDVVRLQNARAIFYRLAKLFRILKQLAIPASELDFVFILGDTIGWYDLANIPIASIEQAESLNLAAWLRLSDSYRLNRQIFTGTFSVVQLLNLIHNGLIDRETMLTMLSEQTGWTAVALRFLTSDRGYNFSFPQDFQDERWLGRLQQAFYLIQKSGVTASQIWRWNTPNANSDLAQQIRNAAKARYDAQQWLEIAPELSDRLRIKRRNALRDYLIATHSEFRDADDLYAHFLIDSEMSPCFMTSRIRQAISSIQFFVNRVFLGLESNVHFDRDEAEQWAWRKNYRVWEANRKVFLYPENYAEPELRDDKTPFFEELREALLQEEVTADAVERAYLTYLRRLDEVARLEISGLYVEDEVVHIFARTRGVPPIYYYRRWVDQSYFTAWEKVEITIEGNHLLPVVYNRRLWLLWPTFTEKAVTPSSSQLNSNSPKSPEKYWEIKLSWSELRNGKWSTPKTSEGAISTYIPGGHFNFEKGRKSRYYFWAEVTENSLYVYPFYQERIPDGLQPEQPGGYFQFAGCSDQPIVFYRPPQIHEVSPHHLVTQLYYVARKIPHRVPKSSSQSYMKFEQGDIMTLFSDIKVHLPSNDDAANLSTGQVNPITSKIEKILTKAPKSFYITPPHQYLYFQSQSPFFYEDARRTFFVIPETVYKSNSGSRDSRGYRSLETSQLDLGALAGIRVERFILNRSVDVVPERTTRLATSRKSDRIFTATDQNTVINRIDRIATEIDEETDQLASEMSTLAIIPSALPGVAPTNGRLDVDIVTNGTPLKIYNFRTFYHPYTCLFIEQVNRFGIEGLLKPNPKGKGLVELHRQLTPNSPFKFSATYGPQSPLTLNSPIENIDFTYKGAYSQYNWELFFHIPMLIANQLSQNQRFAEAQRWYHYIFDPTETDDEGLDADERQRRFWKLKPFYQFSGAATIQEIIRLINQGDPDYEEQIEQWEENPFNPHLIARLRTVAYMQLVVMKYLDNLIAWGDNLFKQDTIESINEATQLYILAAQLLGRKPEQVKARNVEAHSFAELRSLLDELGNAQVSDTNQSLSPLIALENQIKVALQPKSVFQAELLKARIENNATLEPAEKELVALQPANAIVALANTMTFVSRTPTPDRPTPTLYFCILPNDKLLGYWGTVGDRLFKIRNCMNIEGVTRPLALFEPPIDPALLVKAVAAGIDLSSALSNLNAPLPHYRFSYMLPKALELCNEVKSLGNSLLSAIEKRDAEELSLIRAGHEGEVLQSIRQMKQKAIEEANDSITSLEKSRDLADIRHQFYSSRQYKNDQETTHTSELEKSRDLQEKAEIVNMAASFTFLIPSFTIGVSGAMGSPVATISLGGEAVGNSLRAASGVVGFLASRHTHAATMASNEGGNQRRGEEWAHQAALALKEIEQINAQITAARVRVEIAEKDLENQALQIQNSQEVFQFMKDKYTTQQLYSWMITQISTLYFQSYQMAYDLAKRAEQCFRYELGIENSNFIQFGYWDSLKKGLLSGDRLYKDLKRMEIAYLEQHKREHEITKHISLATVDPIALLQLRETGECFISIPEVLFDLDLPGHYMRRIKSVSLTIPCVTGPYTSVNCTLTLMSNRVRKETSIEPQYAWSRDFNDTRFNYNLGGIQSIATSNAQNDSGLFELNFRDERYLPFEGAGAISEWRIELPNEFRQFDYNTISDVIIHMRYTAREGGGTLKEAAIATIRDTISQVADAATGIPLARLFSAKHEFPGEWHQFLHPAGDDSPHTLEMTLDKERFPFLFNSKTIIINSIELHLKLKEGGSESSPDNVTLTPPGSQPVEVNNFTPPTPPTPPNRPLPWASVNLSSEVSDSSIWILTASNVNPNELEDIFVVCQYSVST